MYFTNYETPKRSKMLSPEDRPTGPSFWNAASQTWRDSNANIVGIMSCAAGAANPGHIENLTELKNQELIAEKKLREHFVIALSHDLRGPLATARMSAELLESNCQNTSEVLKFAEMISRNIDRADQMIRDLLDANQIKAGEKLSLYIEQCDLQKLVEETLADLSTVYGDRFQLNCSHSVKNFMSNSIVGYWSKNELRRVLENLCSNAVKYGDEKAPIKVRLIKTKFDCHIEVQNQGPLISEKDQIDLFDHHRRTKSAKAGSVKGWGLGLALVKGIAEAHGGVVAVESSEAAGTVFRVVIPLDSRKES